ncbi:hypothetical protein BASA81_003428 [Batrachochytrium salamandrivorans]|nr:hypothetical protein BASA81_003428 [Batrachochytrium salamandrivorans]
MHRHGRHLVQSSNAPVVSAEKQFALLNTRIHQCISVSQLAAIVGSTTPDSFNSVNCATAIYKLGRIRDSNSTPLFNQLLGFTKTKRLGPQSLSSVCQGLALAGLPVPDYVVTQVVNMPRTRYKPMDLATLAWSFASLGRPPSKITEWLSSVTFDVAMGNKELPHRDLSMLMWSLAKLQHQSFPVLFNFVLTKLQDHKLDLALFSNQDLVMLIWSCAHGQIGDKLTRSKVFDHLEQFLLSKSFKSPSLRISSPHDLSSILWSLATAKREPSMLVDRVFNTLLDKQHECTGQDVSNALWGLAKLRHVPTRNFTTNGLDFTKFTDQALGNTLWALAVLGGTHVEWLDLLLGEIAMRPGHDVPTYNLAWSLACLDVLDKPVVVKHLSTISNIGPCLSLEDAMQLQQFKLAWPNHLPLPKFASNGQTGAPSPVDVFLRQQQPITESSHVHLQIASALQAKLPKDLVIVNECHTLPNLFGIAVDMYIPAKRLVIEVDGPNHYSWDNRSMLGSTRFKHRLITKQG